MRVALISAALAFAAGCAHPDITSAELPLRSVVIYRNGVGYFERAGHVEAEEVTFKMRQRMVGDFLATLAIVERGGSSLRSASFPLEIDRKRVVPGVDPEFARALDAVTRPPGEEPDPEKLRKVVLRLDGKEHDLAVGYVAATPLWRPSYRLVVRPGGQADLQVWGIVQNVSGEDWNKVKLTLVAGAPIAFESTLGDPVTPRRPVITDEGEVFYAVPESLTILREEAPAEMAPAPPVEEPAPSRKGRARAEKEKAEAEADEGYGYSFDDSPMTGGGMDAPTLQMMPSAPRNLSELAAIAVTAGTTRYQIPSLVTVPNESATMVLLVNSRVPGEAVFLFSPDYGVPDSVRHPFRVVRFGNQSRGLLEKGPIAVFEQGAFLGQGILEQLPAGATATVPFALERGLAVESEQRHDETGAVVQRIEGGTLVIEREQVLDTLYKVRNGLEEETKLLVRHPRMHGARLHKPPKGTEDNTGTGQAIVPIQVRPHARAELRVEERLPMRRQVDWMDPLADVAVRAYLADRRSDQNVVQKLGQAWAVREKLQAALDAHARAQAEQHELEKQARETRKSLEAIEKNPQAGDLRRTLTARLADVTSELDRVTKRLIEAKLAINELEVRLRDAVRAITLREPTPEKN
jgi:hypothetical protein